MDTYSIFFICIKNIIKGKFLIVDCFKTLFEIIFGIDQPIVSAQLWFIYALFTVEILWICIDTAFKKTNYKYIFVLFLALIGIILNISGITHIIFRLETALIVLPIFTLGIFIKENPQNTIIKHLTRMNTPTLIIGCVIWGICSYLNIKISNDTGISLWKERFNFFPLYYFNAILGTLCLINIAKNISTINYTPTKYIVKFFAFFGKNSTSALVTVNILIALVGKFVYLLPYLDIQIKAIIIFIIVTVLQFPVAKILNSEKLKFSLGKF